jgi:hypothetical protein
MKVLMSGFTALQINTDKRTIQKIDVPASIAKALRELGHDVDWRKITPGEDLSSYDVLWINLAPLNSLNGRQGAMGALYALSSGIPCVGFFDDWQFNTVFNGARALIRKPEMLYKHLLVGTEHRGDEGATYFSRADVEAALERVRAVNPDAAKKCYIERYYMMDTDESVQPYEKQLVEAARDLIAPRWEAGMVPVCPMYAFGDRSIVRKRMPNELGPIEALDPTSTIVPTLSPVTPLNPALKKRAWVLGALMPHDTWLEKKNLTWPVEIVGSRKLIRKLGGQRFDTEQDVLEFYNQHWGILSPPYPHAGSGWWRSRFLYAAHVGSILVTDKGEGDPLGDAYKLKIADVEKMSDADLINAVEAQRAALKPYIPDYSTFVDHCDRIIKRAIKEDKGLKRNADGTLA